MSVADPLRVELSRCDRIRQCIAEKARYVSRQVARFAAWVEPPEPMLDVSTPEKWAEAARRSQELYVWRKHED